MKREKSPQQDLPPGEGSILVVDDEPVNRRVLLNLLSLKSYRVTPCSSGYRALQLVEEAPNDFDLVLMDCQMPGMDGLETTREIRKIEKNQSLEDISYIVAMTANTLEDDRRACIDAGMDAFISKPVRISELQNVISKASGGMEFEGIAVTAPSLPKETLQEILRKTLLLGLALPGPP